VEKQKVPIQRGTVQETLLITVNARAEESQRKNPIIFDEKSIELVKRIDYDFSIFQQDWKTKVSIVVRTRIIDDLVQKFITKYPQCIVLNLGCGLCTRFFRVDNSQVRWFDLDLPDVIAFKRSLISETDRYRFIARSVLDDAWVADLKQLSGISNFARLPVLIIAEGVLYYLDADANAHLFSILGRNFPDAECVVEIANSQMVATCYKYASLGSMGLKFSWGIDDNAALEALHPTIRVVGEHLMYNRFRWRWKQYMLLHYVPAWKKALRIVVLRFDKS
jgi:O-methyltransferase involved in polyketide biosynthesis